MIIQRFLTGTLFALLGFSSPLFAAPVANDDFLPAFSEGGNTLGNVGANDAPDPFPALAADFVVVTPPSHSAAFNLIPTGPGAGTFNYTHNHSENFTDSFQYQIQQGALISNVATVTFTINPVDDNDPLASDDAYPLFTDEGDSNSVGVGAGVIANDTDADTDAVLSVIVNAPPAFAASFTLNPNGSFTYEHDGSENHADGFSYRLSDGSGAQSLGNVTITVNPVNDDPFAANDGGQTTDEDTAYTTTGDVTANDSDPDSATLTVTGVTSPSLRGAIVTNNGDGTFEYDPTGVAAFQALGVGDANLGDNFTYTVSDGDGGSDDASVFLTISPVNDRPVAGAVSIAADEDGPTVTDSFNLVSDPDTNDNHAFTSMTQPGEGSVVNNNDGTFTFDPGTDFQDLADTETRDVTFTYTVTDDSGSGNDESLSATVTVTVTGVEDTAVITGTVADSVNENVPSDTAGADLDHTDADGDNADDLWVSQSGTVGKYGALDIGTDGVWLYTLDDSDTDTQLLDDGESVSDETFTVTTSGGTDTTLTLTINGADDAAVITGAVIGTVDENIPSDTASADLDHTDVDGDDADDAWVVQTASAGKYGALDVDDRGNWTYTLDDTDTDTQLLDDGESVSDETFTVTTSGGTDTTLTLTINGADDAAVITGAVIGTVDENIPSDTASADLDHTDVDGDDADDTWVVQTASAGKYGALDVDAAGNWTYTLDDTDTDTQLLDDGESVSDETFTVTTSGGTDTTLTLTINGANDAAIIAGAVIGTVDENTPSDTVGADLDHTDVDGDDADDTWVVQTASAGKYGALDVDDRGNWTYTLDDTDTDTQLLDDGESVSDETFSVSTTDGTTTTLTITVNGADDAAVITGAVIGTVDENIPSDTASADLDHTDVDGDDADDTWVVQTASAGKYGALDVDAAGNWTYTLDDTDTDTQLLDDGESVSDETFTVTTSGGTDTTLTLTINGADDAAVITGAVIGAVDENIPSDTASADLDHTDVDGDDANDTWVVQTASAGKYGALDVDAAGNWTYTLDDTDTDTQLLDDGESVSDETFTVTTSGGTDTMLTLTINGADDAAVITGAVIGTVDENTPSDTASADLDHTDVDGDDADDTWVVQTASAGKYGALDVDAAGNWTYTLDDTDTDTQLLDDGESVSDETFTVTTSGGTDTTLTLTINGADDAAVITGAVIGTVDENTPSDTVSADLDHTDVDGEDGNDVWITQAGTVGKYGALDVDAAGNWTYTLDDTDTDTQLLDDGESVSDETFTVTTSGGTDTTLTLTVNGADDAAVITGAVIGTVDENIPSDTASADLDHTDVDGDDADDTWVVQTASAGKYGALDVDAAGNWTYTLDDTDPDTQLLDDGESVSDETFTVTTSGGTDTTLTLTINGADDAAVITGAVIGTVDENIPSDTASADLDHTDVDGDDADDTWVVQTASAGKYGALDVDAAGNWTYTLDDTDTDTQLLDDGESVSDETFTVTTSGGTDTTLTLTINGANDAAIIAGAVIGTVDENTPSDTVGADLDHTDVDGDDADDDWTTQVGTVGKYGSLDVDAAGNWTYTLDDTDPDTQLLDDGESVSDETFSVSTTDGTTTTLTITVNGADDAAVITGAVIGTVDENTPSDTASADLDHTDVDGDDANDTWNTQAGTVGKYGTLDIDAAGNWTYTLDDTDPDTQLLDDGESVSDETFTVTTSGGTDTTLTLTINGADDAAVITGAVIGTVDENTPSDTAGADLDHTDVDGEDGNDVWITQSGTVGKYGTLDVDVAGNWTYTLDDTDPDTQLLDDGESVSDETFTVTTSGGTDTTLTLTINGADDAAVITGAVIGTVDENIPSDTASADLDHTDVDGDDADDTWVVQTASAGKYGALDVDAAGNWTYTLDDTDPDTQLLDDGESVSDETFTVTTSGGTDTTLTLTINGADDAALITGAVIGTVDENTPSDTAGADLDHTDVDGEDGNDVWITQAGTVGKYGTLDVDVAGNWTYTLDDTDPDTQLLDDGESVSDETFTVTTSGGTDTTLTLTINGANDAAVIAGTVIGSVDENTPSDTVGADLNHTDVDGDDADDAWITQTSTVGIYGSLDLDAAGNWLYTVDDTDPDTQALDAGDTVSDETFVVSTTDGTTTTLTLTLNGAADAAVITGVIVGSVDENVPSDTIGADLNHSDVDGDDVNDSWVAQTGVAGKYGSFSIDVSGVWLYTLDDVDADTNVLDNGDIVSDETFLVSTADGTTTTLTLTINGRNDVPEVTSNGGATLDLPFDEGSTSTITTITGDDPDGDDGVSGVAVTFGIDLAGGADGGLFSIDSVSGALSFTVAPSFEALSDADNDNTYEVTVQAIDDELAVDTQLVRVALQNVNQAPTASNLTDTVGYTEDVGSVNLTNIVVVDGDDVLTPQDITVNLSLDDSNSGALTTPGSATFDSGSGIWTITDTVANVNAALASVTFVTAADHDTDTFISTEVRDQNGAGPAIGRIDLIVTPVNDTPDATNLTVTTGYVEDQVLVNLDNIVVSDVDDEDHPQSITATLTLADAAAAGSLTTSGTASYTPATGIWTITGTVADVNAALAAVQFAPTTNYDVDTTITTQIDDAAAGPGGVITLDVTPVNDNPTATNLTGTITYDEDELGVDALQPDIVISDVDDADYPQTITVTITEADYLPVVFGTPGSSTFDSDTGVWTITDTLANVNAALASLTFDASLDWDDDSSFQVVISDQDMGGPAASNITLDVIPANDDPVVDDQAYAIDENAANGTVVGTVVVFNAESVACTPGIDPGCQDLAFSVSGTAFDIDEDGILTVANTADLDREAQESIVVTVTVTDDGTPIESDTAAITVTLNPLNDNEPTGVIDVAAVDELDSVSFNVLTLGEDIDLDIPAEDLTVSEVDGDPAKVGVAQDLIVDGVTVGALTIEMDGSATFDASLDNTVEKFQAELSYTVSDDTFEDTDITVTINLNPQNDNQPELTSEGTDFATAGVQYDEGTYTSFNKLTVILNDYFIDLDIDEDGLLDSSTGGDNDGLDFSIVANSNPTLISMELNDGDLAIFSPSDEHGVAEVTIRATDTAEPSANISFVDLTFTITVNSVNDGPQYVGSYANTTVDEDSGTIAVPLRASFSDKDIDGDSDPSDDQLTFTITIVDTPNPAVESFVFDDTGYTLESEDLDVPGAGSRTLVIETTNNDFSIPLTADAHGSIAVTVRATDLGRPPELPADPQPLSVERSFTITVNGIGDDTPDAEDDHYNDFPILIIDEDSDGVVFDPTDNDYLGDTPTTVISVGATLTDSNGQESTWRSTSRVTQRTNTADTTIEMNGEVSCAASGCQDDQTPNTQVSGAGLGTSEIIYKPGLDFNGEDTFIYCIQDGFPGGEVGFTPPADDRCATITVLVNPVNDLPRVPGDILYTMDQADDLIVPVEEGLKTKVTGVDNTHIDGLGCDPNEPTCNPGPGDPQPDVLYFFFDSAVTANGQLIPPFETDGSFNYRPSATFAGSDTFIFDVCETLVPTTETCIFDIVATISVDAIEGAPEGLSDDVVEVDFDLADIPLELPVGPEANVLVINDDSGSMGWDMLTDQNSGLYYFSTGNYIRYTMKATAGSSESVAPSEEAAPGQGLWRLRNSTFNKVYYNPEIRYDPWNGLNPNNVDFPQSSPTAAVYNPMSPSGSRTNLRQDQADYRGYATVTTTRVCTTRCSWRDRRGRCRATYQSCSGGGTSFTRVTTEDLYLPRYYLWTDENGNGVMDAEPSPFDNPDDSEGVLVEIKPAAEGGSDTYPKAEGRSDCIAAVDSCSFDEEIQNFANWFTYSRSREFTAKSALGKVIAASENIRIGYAKLNSSDSLKQIESMNNSERTGTKADLLEAIYLTNSALGTPLRRSLRDAGRHFECRRNDIFNSNSDTIPGAEGCPLFAAPAGNCQQNFALLISDGEWTGDSPNIGDEDDNNDTNFDGGVYAGSFNNSLADVAMEYYERDLHSTLLNEVPTSARDIDGAAADAFENGSNVLMHQHMKTFTVGFGVNGLVEDGDVPTDYTQSFNWGTPNTTERKIDDMRHAALNGRGEYLSAGNAATLAEALVAAFEEFQQGSGAASAVSFNSQEILEDTLVFRSFYNTKNNTGDLIAQGIDQFGTVEEDPTWNAAARLDEIEPENRVIITLDRDPLSANFGEGIPFRPASLNDVQRAAFISNLAAPQAQQDLEVLQRVNYLRGDDANERPTGNFRERPGVEGRLGDIVHSAPTFIGLPSRLGRDVEPFPQSSLYSDFKQANELRTPVVYVAANDGMLHGFDAETGDELLAYVPDNLMTNIYSRDITELLNYEYAHKYFVDSTPAVNDVFIDADGDGDKEWRTILVSAHGAGAKAYFALDITDPSRFSEDNADEIALWEFTDDDDTYPTDAAGDPLLDADDNQRQDLLTPARPVKDIGYTYSVPTIAMTNLVDADGENKWVAIAGNGYNSTAGIAKLFVFFLDGGIDGVWCHPDMIHNNVLDGPLPSDCVGKQDFIKLNTGFGVQLGSPNGLGEPRAIDVDGNGTVDYAYAGDMQGNFFRFDLTDTDERNWSVTKIFQAQYKPGTLDEKDQPITTQPIAIIHPTEEEGFILIFGSGAYMRTGDSTDNEIQSIYGLWDRLGPELIDKSDLQEQSYTNIDDPLGLVRTLSANEVDYSIVGGKKGWFIDLDPPPPGFPEGSPADFPGERAVRNIQLRGGLAFVNSIFPRQEGSCVGRAGGATLAFCPDTGSSSCFSNRTVFDLNDDGAFDDGDDVNIDQTAAGIILTDPSPPTDSTFIGDQRVTQYGRELHIIGTNTSSGSNTGRLSWKMMESVD